LRAAGDVPVSVSAFGEIASCFDAFLQAAADGDEAAFLLAAVVEAEFAVAVPGGVTFEAVVDVGFGAHWEFLLEMSFDLKWLEDGKRPGHSVI